MYNKAINTILLSVLLSLFVYIIRPFKNNASSRVLKNQAVIIRATSAPAPTPTPEISVPKRLIIPKLNVDSLIEPVSNNASGIMDLPEDPFKVGWYETGYKPGEKGNAVIGGHLDLVTGEPGIFFRLNELIIGDIISIIDEENARKDFMVINTQIYKYEEIPNQLIFGESDRFYLNLITCSGWFNNITKNYSHRLVINSELLETTKNNYNN